MHACYADSLLSPQLAEFQGPALLAYNDGIFTEKVGVAACSCVCLFLQQHWQ